MKTTPNRRNALGTLCCVLGAVSWGFSGTCSEALFRDYAPAPAWVTAVRMTAAGVLLLLFVTLRQGAGAVLAPMADRKSRRDILIFTLTGLLMCQLAYLSAIRWTNSGTATVLQNLSIVLIAVFVCITTRTLPGKKQLSAILLALVGVWLLATGGRPGAMQLTPAGLFWGIAAALGAASYSLLSREPVARWGSLPVTGLGMFIGGVTACLGVRVWNIPAGLDARAVGLLALVVLIGTVGAFTLFLQGISMVGPVKASVLACLEPMTAALLSMLWLGNSFSAADLAGFACILTTVFLLRD